MIFVFASNLAGNHAGGAALEALTNFGAEPGISQGPTGRAYAIPTLDSHFKPLHLKDIEWNIHRFLEYAQAHPTDEFFITAIGCGIAGFKPEQIAPMFKDAPMNCTLHRRFVEVLNRKK